jgi:hypothetical protein
MLIISHYKEGKGKHVFLFATALCIIYAVNNNSVTAVQLHV